MERDKQIEEMAKQIYGNFGLSMPTARNIATYLTNKQGYLKASEVAREIFEEIEKQSYYMDTGFGDEAEVIACDDIAELKKKYTEEGK